MRKYGLYSERYRTLAACSSTSIFFSDTGGRAIYCERASRALEEAAANTAALWILLPAASL